MLDSRARPEPILLLSVGADKNGYAQQVIKNEGGVERVGQLEIPVNSRHYLQPPSSLMMTSFDELDG
jgi:hypothetical protein